SSAINVVGDLGPEAKVAVPALVALLKDTRIDKVDRVFVVRALGRLGPQASASVPDLIEVLKSDDLYLRIQAATTLGQIGPDAKAAVPLLHDLLHDMLKHPSVEAERSAVFEALRKIGPAP